MGQLTKLIVALKPLLPLAFVGILLLSLGILGYLFVILRSARKRQALQEGQRAEVEAAEAPRKGEAVSPGPAGEAVAPSGELRQSFAQSLKLLKAHVAGKNYRYEIPWFMVVGEAESGKTTALRHTGLYLPLGEPYEDDFVQQRCSWWFFDRGVVLDVAGDFVLRADGTTSDEKGWSGLLRLLQRHRPERPIDGVVLTVPCTDLLGPQGASDQGRGRVKEKADLLYKKLWHAQKALGVCFPVYLLVTKCDQVPGFKSFCSEIPPPRRQDIFGWSSPYVLEAGFTPDWVNEAFQGLLSGLYQAQSELFTEVKEVKDSDGLFLFPSEFQSMLETLRVFLNQIFRPSVYHESFFFRGVYFCGDGQAGPAPPPPALAQVETEPAPPTESEALPPAQVVSAPSPKPYFLKDLFEKKVFPEQGLARPSRQTVFSRNVAVTAAQGLLAATLLVGGVGLWRGYGKLKGQIKTLEPVLRGIAVDLKKSKESGSLVGEAERQAHQRKASLDLLRGMASADANRLRSAFFPSTWLSGVHRDIRYSMSLAYDEIILKSILVSLNQRAKDILNRDRRIAPADTARAERVLPLEEVPEFVALRSYVEEVVELERHGAAYNGLRNTRELSDLSRLVNYLYGIEMPPDFFQNAEYYHGALSEARYRLFESGAFKGQASENARELVRRLYDRLFENNALKVHAEDVALQLEGLEERKARGYQEEGRFQDLLDTLTEMEAALSGPELAWVFGPTLDLGPPFEQVLDAFDASNLLGPGLRAEAVASGEKAFQRLKADLAACESPLTGPIFQNGGGQLTLSPRVTSLKAVLADFLGRDAGARASMRVFRAEIPPGMRLTWDTGLLETAAGLPESHTSPVDELKIFPMAWQNTLQRMASGRLRAKMVDLIAQAQTFEPALEGGARVSEEDLRPEVRNFREAARPLAVLLNLFDRLDFTDPYADLSDLTVAQASQLLASVDRLLENEELYEVGDLSAWDGLQPLSPVVFGARDAADMNYYLDVQRERIKYIADEYADPLIAFLGNSKVARGQVYVPMLSKWQRLLSELRKYENKKPGNSLATLEGFILTDMDQITLENFSQRLRPPDLAEQSGDFFLQRRNRLRREVYERCREVAEDRMVAGYTAIERFFNQNLAGKFPFSGGDAGEAGAEADPEDLREFYRLYDRTVRVDREFLKQSKKFGASTDSALEFLYQMDRVRGFLQAFRGDDERAPVVDLDVDFRVNQRNEAGGNQIIDWILEVGDRKIQAHDAERRGRWSFGDPIRLSLRWAKDAPDAPAPVANRGVRVEERTVIYEYPNRWSLFSLLKNHASAPTDFGSLVDPKPYTLRFVIETRPAGKGDKKEGPPAGTAKVFVRVTPVSPDQKERLVLPAFPEKAPPLNQEKVSRNE